MLREIKQNLALWLRQDRLNTHKINLIDYMQERICKYSNEEKTPSEQVKGMNRLLRDIINLDDEMFEDR